MCARWFNPALVLILFAALALRLAAGVWWQSRLPPGDKFGMHDSETYWALGRTIAEGTPYQLGPNKQVFRTPGYPALLAPLFLIFGREPPAAWAFAESALLSTAAVAAVYGLTRSLFDRRIGLVAAGIAAIYPGAISEGALVLSEAPFVPLMLVSLWFWSLAWWSPTGRRRLCWGLAAGIASGLAILMRPSWLMFVPFALVIGVAVCPARLRQLAIGAEIVISTSLMMARWWIRNWGVTGHVVLTTLQVGPSFYDGLNPQADGSSNMRIIEAFERGELVGDDSKEKTAFDSLFYRFTKVLNDYRKVQLPLNAKPNQFLPVNLEWLLDVTFRNEAIAWARAYPGRTLQLSATKFRRIWNPWPNEPKLQSVWLKIMVAATYLPLLSLSLWGIVRYGVRGWPFALCWLPAVYFTMLHMVFVASIRYREPAMIAMMPLAAAVLVERVWPAMKSHFV